MTQFPWSNEFRRRARRASWLIPKGSSVVDLGAGVCTLREYLRDCEYVPVDRVRYKEAPCDVVVADLEHGVPDLGRRFDIATLLGVLEYISDIGVLVARVANVADRMVVSYMEPGDNSLGRKNHLTRPEALAIALSAGWSPVREIAFRGESVWKMVRA